MSLSRTTTVLALTVAVAFSVVFIGHSRLASSPRHELHLNVFDRLIAINSKRSLAEGRETFRFDTFGDEDFWGGTLQLHRAIEGAKLGGVGPGVSPKTALAVGLKVDVDALPPKVLEALKHGSLDLNDPAVTLALLKLDAVVGVKG